MLWRFFSISKPVIYFNYKRKIHNEDYKSLDIKPLEEIFKNQFGINLNSLEELDTKLNNINLIVNNYIQDLIKFEKYLYTCADSITLAKNYLNKH